MRNLFILALLSVGLAGGAAAEQLMPEDFAYGYQLETAGKTPFYSVPIPHEVYRTALSRDLGDIRVFDAGKSVVAHQLRRREPANVPDGPSIPVPFFPLYAEGRSGEAVDDLAMRVEKDAGGAIVDVRISGESVKDERYLRGYLLDLHDLDFAAGSRLELQWGKPENTFVSLSVDQSTDLTHWRPLVTRAVIARLHHGNRGVEQREVMLPGKPLPYVRITWDGDRPLLLEGVKGQTKGRLTEVKRLHQLVESDDSVPAGREREGGGGTYYALSYTMPFQVSISEAQLKLPAVGSSLKAALYSRPERDGQWRRRCEQVFYRLELSGESLTNQPCTFRPTADIHWELRILADGAGIVEGATPQLELGWIQDELLFAGRGASPYMLAFGNGKLSTLEQNGSVDHLSRVIDLEKNRQLISSSAFTGDRITLGGESALVVPVTFPWKKWLLWGVLVAGMCLLAAMALIVHRELAGSREGESKKPE